MKSLPELVEFAAKKYNSKIAIEEIEKKISFKDIYSESIKVAKYLKKNHLKNGDRVSIYMNKSINQVISIIGVSLAGGVFVPILPNLKKDSLKHIIYHSGSKTIITDCKKLLEVRNINFKGNLLICDSNYKKKNKNNLLFQISNIINTSKLKKKIDHNSDAAIIYSSGSTGMPKGIVIPHKNFEFGARIVSKYLHTKKNDRIACVLSFNFDYGLNQLWQSLHLGCKLYLYEINFYQDFFKFCRDKKITVIPLMPVIISMLTANNQKGKNFNIKYICTSGGSVSKKMITSLKRFFPNAKIYLMYGLTEAFRSSYLNPKKSLNKFFSIGKSIPSVKLNVIKKNFAECKVNEIGELVHRGGCVASRYWKDKSSTKKRFRTISRFPNEITVFSGDLVKKDKSGDLIFVSRMDSMIKTMGFRVSPSEIENQAIKHKNIYQCVAFSEKDEVIGEKIILSYTSVNKKKIKVNQLKNFLTKKLSKHMMPKEIIYLKKFKATGNQGKIDKNDVVDKSLKIIKNAHN
jgi:acyl-CoA synthetase (AMP-forming)/AMP-acid ligase II